MPSSRRSVETSVRFSPESIIAESSPDTQDSGFVLYNSFFCYMVYQTEFPETADWCFFVFRFIIIYILSAPRFRGNSIACYSCLIPRYHQYPIPNTLNMHYSSSKWIDSYFGKLEMLISERDTNNCNVQQNAKKCMC